MYCMYVCMSVCRDVCLYAVHISRSLCRLVCLCVCVFVCVGLRAAFKGRQHGVGIGAGPATPLPLLPPHTLATLACDMLPYPHTHTHTQTRHTPITHRALCAPRRRRGAVPGTRYPLRATRFPNDFCFCFSFFFNFLINSCVYLCPTVCVCVCIYCVYRFSIFTLPLPFFIFNFYLFACFFSAFYSPLFLSFFLFLSHSVVVVVVFFFLINRFRSRRGHKSGILLILF